MSVVSFVRAESCEPKHVEKAVKDSLNLIGFNFSRNAGKIVIKPNMCYYYHPSTGEVTDPRFVGALIDVFRETLGAKEILVVESDASAMKCKNAFSMLGYDKMAKEKDVSLINLAEEKCTVVNKTVDGREFQFHIPELFAEADLVVNVPKPKYQEGVKLTCALKNFFGCNGFKKKYVYHKIIDEAIVTLNERIKTHLVVLDGLTVVGTYTKRLNLVMSSQDLVAADSAVSTMMGMSPRSIGAIALAAKRGLGTLGFSPVGEFNYFVEQFPSRTLKDNLRATAAGVYMKFFGEN